MLVIDVLALGYVGAMPAEGIYLLIARVGTIYYFAHFLIVLPVLSRIEKTEPVPLSISRTSLGGMLKAEMARIDRKMCNLNITFYNYFIIFLSITFSNVQRKKLNLYRLIGLLKVLQENSIDLYKEVIKSTQRFVLLAIQ